jgi:hypothetical protein
MRLHSKNTVHDLPQEWKGAIFFECVGGAAPDWSIQKTEHPVKIDFLLFENLMKLIVDGAFLFSVWWCFFSFWSKLENRFRRFRNLNQIKIQIQNSFNAHLMPTWTWNPKVFDSHASWVKSLHKTKTCNETRTRFNSNHTRNFSTRLVQVFGIKKRFHLGLFKWLILISKNLKSQIEEILSAFNFVVFDESRF